MSESDSDLEFESADEDTEQDCSEKCGTVSKSENDSKIEVAALENLSITEVTKETEDKNVPSAEIKEQELREKPCVGTEKSSGSSSELVRSNEKQRVTLRLEKKLQKKNSSKESSTEKVSDVVDSSNTTPTSPPPFTSQPLSTSKTLPTPEAPVSSLTPPDNKPAESSWGFGGWGTSLLTTFTTQVSQGIGTVLETVESGLGVPAPEQLASRFPPSPDGAESGDITKQPEESKEEVGSGFLGDISSWTRALENTGSKLLYGGLDTLELIGKKTIDILTEGDPGLRKKRAAVSEHLTLSQILREAKEQASQTPATSEEEDDTRSPVFGQLLEDYRGLQHLEALEMLSKQSVARLRRIKHMTAAEPGPEKSLEEIRVICALEEPQESEDFETVVRRHVLQMDLPFNVDCLLQIQKRPNDSVADGAPAEEPEQVYHSSLHSLALFTSRCMETFHKLAELLLVRPNDGNNAVHFATHLSGLASAMCSEVDNLTSTYQKKLELIFAESDERKVTETVTNLYVEAENSRWYIENTFRLLVPILQERALSVTEE